MPQEPKTHSQAAAKYRAPRKVVQHDSDSELEQKSSNKTRKLLSCRVTSHQDSQLIYLSILGMIATQGHNKPVTSAKKVARPVVRNTVAQQAAVHRAKAGAAKAKLAKKLKGPPVAIDIDEDFDSDSKTEEEEAESNAGDGDESEGTIDPAEEYPELPEVRQLIAAVHVRLLTIYSDLLHL